MSLKSRLPSTTPPRPGAFGLPPTDDTLFYRKSQILMSAWSVPLIGAMALGLLATSEPTVAAVPIIYTVVTIASLLALRIWDFFPVYREGHNALVLLAPVAVHHQLGGFAASGGILVWCVLPPITAMMWIGAQASTRWLAFALLAVASGGLAPVTEHPLLTPTQQSLFFMTNVLGLTAFSYGGVRHFVVRLALEKDRSEKLLANVLPETIAARLRVDPHAIAERHEHVTVLFADLVGFTELSRRLPPRDVVHMLNDVFTEMDRLADTHGLEKIKTIGDAYMVVGGLLESLDDSTSAVARMALDVLKSVASMRSRYPNLSIRIGMHTGPVVAGVIGQRRFAYDLWGETVNLAARMESHGLPGQIQVTPAVQQELAAAFELESRGIQTVKGVGELETWWLLAAERP